MLKSNPIISRSPHNSRTSTSERNTFAETNMELNATSLSNHNSVDRKSNNHNLNDSKHKMTRTLNGEQQLAASNGKPVVYDAPMDSSPLSQTIAPFPHHGQRPSLAGFDPFSVDTEQGLASPVERPHHRHSTTPHSPHVADDRSRRTLQKISLSAASASAGMTSSINGGRVQSSAMMAENRSQGNRDRSPANEENHARQPATPTKSPILKPVLAVGAAASAPTTPKKKEKAFSFSPRHERHASQPTTANIFSLVRKGHRRTKSLESNTPSEKDLKITPAHTQDSLAVSIPSDCSIEDKASELRPGDNSSGGDNSNGGIVQDLMEIKDKFIQLQIPSLAKPSPTSFLTGKGEEAVRTSEYEPSPFQMELPSLSEVMKVARLNDFVENYRRMDQNFDLRQFVGQSSMELQHVKIKEHIPIAQSLLDCGEDFTVQGFLSVGSNADDRSEAVIFEGQRYFTVVFRGTTEQQTKLLGSSKSKKKPTPLDLQQKSVEVYSGFKDEYAKLEQECFALVDKLCEENPFCDVVFSGYSFGAAMATLAASRYAMARPMMRVGCFTLASPKVGFSLFRHVVNSLPNLKVVRIELGQDAKCQTPTAGGWHVGHTLVLSGSIGHQTSQKIHKAYKFGTPKHKKFKTSHPDLRNYVSILEETARVCIPWPKDFVNTAGKGVVVNNEARQVV